MNNGYLCDEWSKHRKSGSVMAVQVLYQGTRSTRYLAFAVVFLLIFTTKIFAQNKSYDKTQGEILAGIIENQIGLYQKEKVETLVDTIGQRLVNNLNPPRYQYRFKILDIEEPNAFALPAGHIYVTRGLLLLANNEDELANVISHEIIHAQHRHAYRQMKPGIITSLLLVPGSIVSNYLGAGIGNIVNAPFAVGGGLIMSGYSKKHEKEADLYGMALASEAGYDPGALEHIIKNMSAVSEKKTGKKERRDYFGRHPYTPKRLEYLSTKAAELARNKPATVFSKEDFLEMLDGVTVGANPEKGVFEENKFVHPSRQIHLWFPEGWKLSSISKAVVAIAPDEEGLLLLNLGADPKLPELAAEEFLNTIDIDEVEILANRPIEINGMPGFLVTLQMMTEEKTMYMQNLWIRNDSLTYNIVGAGTDKYLEALKAASLSFRRSYEEELNDVKIEILKIIEAREGECLEDLALRINDKSDIGYLEIINGLDRKLKLKEGRKVKVVTRGSYVDRR